jgi:D-arginine dehydrogenase
MTQWDVVIVGAGIAGASLADTLAGHRSVLLIEGEAQPGYHSTGRSAAFWSETYGGPKVQPLTTASKPFLETPDPEFSALSFLRPRGALFIGTRDMRPAADELLSQFGESGVALMRLDKSGLEKHLQGTRPDWCEALWEPDCCDIDVAALHAAYLRSARNKGAKIECSMDMQSAAYRNGQWEIQTANGSIFAKLLVNAAGAWADSVALRSNVRCVGLQPYRRTVVQVAVDPPAAAELPLVIGLDNSFYFKPEAGGKLWLSPHDETPIAPCDVAAEEMDVAIAIDRLADVVDWKVERLETKWAGLRTFAPDRLPVVGHDAGVPEFFWLAGQGGYGIQTAPAMAIMAASQILGHSNMLEGMKPADFRPDRF